MLNSATSYKLRLGVITSACFFLLSPIVCAKSGAMVNIQINRQLLDTIGEIRNRTTINSRTEAAEHLALLTRGIDARKVDDATVAEMMSLLETREDSVRAWV